MRIYHNIPALNAYNSLNATNSALTKSIKKLSSGLRINSAADDAAGLAISEKMRAQISGMDVAIRNAQDGVSMLQTAEGALESTQSILQRMRELAVQAANDTLTARDREYIQLEIDELKSEINNIAHTTKFNGKRLLDGTSAGLWSSDKLTTKAFIRGSLIDTDQFNQKNAFEGNYRIQITADPGRGQIMKTDVMKVSVEEKIPHTPGGDAISYHAASPHASGTFTETKYGAEDVITKDLPAGDYLLQTLPGAKAPSISVTDSYGITGIGETTVTDPNTGLPVVEYVSVANDLESVTYQYLDFTITHYTDAEISTLVAGNNTLTGKFTVAIGNQSIEIDLANINLQKPDTNPSSPPGTMIAKTGEEVSGEVWDEILEKLAELSDQLPYEFVEITNVTDNPSTTPPTTGGTLCYGSQFIGAMGKPTAQANQAAGMLKITNNNTSNINFSPTPPTSVGPTLAATLPGVAPATTKSVLTIGNTNNFAIDQNASILFEVTGVNGTQIDYKATANFLATDGTVTNGVVQTGTAFAEGGTIKLFDTELGTGAFTLTLENGGAAKLTNGSKIVFNVTATANNMNSDGLAQTITLDSGPGTIISYGVDGGKLAQDKSITFKPFYVEDDGSVKNSEVTLKTSKLLTWSARLAKFRINDDGTMSEIIDTDPTQTVVKVADCKSKLEQIDKLWTSEGTFLLKDPQTITITQGNGLSTSVTLYATDTLGDMRDKLNKAIAYDLGQAKYATSNAECFVTFVEPEENEDNAGTTGNGIAPGIMPLGGAATTANGTGGVSSHTNGTGTVADYGFETVPGTFIIRSLIAGADGELKFSGDEDLIKALSLNVIQDSKENTFTVSIADAHDNSTIATNVKVTGNKLLGIVHKNVDVEFDAMAGIKAVWNENLHTFELKADDMYTTILHLAENSTVLQVGANEGENRSLDIGNLSAEALGVSKVVVTNRASAARAITILDNAITKVSSQRAKIGAYQNTLEYTVSNLTTTNTNLSEAESRIRDADMAKEMMNFVKLQILNQSGTAMLAQANQLPQSVLSLIGG